MYWSVRYSLLRLLGIMLLLAEQYTYVYTSAYVMLEGDCPGPSILFVRNSVQVTLTSNPLRYTETARRKCSLVFQTQRLGDRLLLHWDALRVMPYNQGHRVFLKNGRYISTPGEGRLDFLGQDYRSHRNHITLFYTGFPHFDYFKVTVTEIRSEQGSQLCLDQDVLCPRGLDSFCISQELLCNGENNCGDLNVSDENHTSCMKSHAPTVPPTSSPMLLGALGILGTQPVIITILIATCCIIKRRQRTERAAEAAENLHRQALSSSFLRARNEYVTLPHNTALMSQKEVVEQGHHPIGGGVHATPLSATLLPQPADSQPLQSLSNVSQLPARATYPWRTLPPTPEEEPESNYVNIHHEGCSLHLPLLFPVPDTNSMPLFHTMGLHKASIAPNAKPSLPQEQDYSLSEPGYVDIEDMNVMSSSSSLDRKKSAKVMSSPLKPLSQGSGSDRPVQDKRPSASQRTPDSAELSQSMRPGSPRPCGDEHLVLDPQLFSDAKQQKEAKAQQSSSDGHAEQGLPNSVPCLSPQLEKIPRR